MSSAELAVVSASPAPKRPRTWKFVGTGLWGTAAFLAMSAAQIVAIFVALGFFTSGEFSEEAFKAFFEHGGVVAGSVLAGMPATLLVLWLATRLARRSFVAYLGLRKPLLKDIMFGIVASAALLVLLDVTAYFAGYPLSPEFALASMRTARDSGLIWLVLLGFCIGAPVTEEFIFRGFVYRGWSTTFLRPAGAIVLSSALFAIIHQQYEWFYIFGIFFIGALFGYLRYRSHSTWVTVITHAFYNLMAAAQALWFIA